jgi:putative SOS response-associated peptidase YedK
MLWTVPPPARECHESGVLLRLPRRRAWCRSTPSASSTKAEGGDIWFALDETRPLACFAGILTNWTVVRKVKEGETTNDIFAFLTTEPNAEVGAIHRKAMPVILTTRDEVETWMTVPPNEALKLQRPLPCE